MNVAAFRKWLEDGGYQPQSVNAQCYRVNKVEEAYGSLDDHFASDQLQRLVSLLTYSLADEKKGKPNPSLIKIAGSPYNSLNSYRSALRRYGRFLEGGGIEPVAIEEPVELAGAAIQERREGKQFELERTLQESLRGEIEQLEPGLTIIDDGVERSVESGSIDILARDADGALVVIELKRGQARRDAIGQVIGYMGDLKAEEPTQIVRGIVVAGDFDQSCRSAVAVVPGLTLRRYRFQFAFEAV